MSIKYPIENSHTLSVEETLIALQSDANVGIKESEAKKRTLEFGTNAYKTQKQKSVWMILLLQFNNPIVYLLFGGAAISIFFRDYIDTIAILIVIFINALIGFFMELQARSSMNALREMDVAVCNVMRDGKVKEIPLDTVCPGDIVILHAGDVIPADGRIIEANQLQCDESALTGESLPSEKNTGVIDKNTALGDLQNMVFKGASVVSGNGKAIITGIASNTEIGTITSLVENVKEESSPLDLKLKALTKKLIWITLFMTVIFVVTGFLQGKEWVIIIETAIALAIAAIPEGLPIVATIALAHGMLLMAKKKAIVKKLSAVETLGSTNVILTDKTGTLTENEIIVNTLAFPDEQIHVSIENKNLKFTDGDFKNSQVNFDKLRLIGVLCNNAYIKSEGNKKKTSGDPLEISLVNLANASGTTAKDLKLQYERITEVPFSSESKFMATFHASPNGNLVAVKGSVEQILQKCTKIQKGESVLDFNDELREHVLNESENMASEGQRVLAFAYNEGNQINQDDYVNNLIYLGMIGFLDPPRMDIKAAMISCRNAGIRIVMITGDHPMTALNIAKKVGLVDENEQNVIEGKDMPDMQKLTLAWKKKILSTSVFARTTPQQKLEIAEVYQKAGNIVAMTGDGVNDAPALKKADVGIAMGLRGTQVAKETASIVLKDDSFTTIAHAVSNGRSIFQNIQKFVVYLVSCNLSEIFIVTSLGFIAPASTLLPLQILFLNMVTDVFPALALGVGKGDKSVMLRPPRDPKQDIVSPKNWVEIASYSVLITISVMLAVVYCQRYISQDSQVINNMAFITLTMSQLFHVFNMSSANSHVFFNDITRNKFVWFAFVICIALLVVVFMMPHVALALDLAILPLNVWITATIISFIPLLVVQLYKLFMPNQLKDRIGNYLNKRH